jgi:serine/threonine-protein kinase
MNRSPQSGLSEEALAMTAGSNRLSQLPSAEWDSLQRILQDFEQAWQQGQTPPLEQYLAEGQAHPALLAELVHLDLEYRLKGGEPVRVEDYLRRFPALAGDRPTLLELLLREYALRRGAAGLTPDEYLGRFPELGPELAPRLAALTADQSGTDDPRRTWVCGGTNAPAAAAGPTRYRPLWRHAQGGLGEVFVAQDEELHREVALKRIQSRYAGLAESRRRFLLEAEITGRLEHPGVVPVHGLVQDEHGEPYYAMRFIQGESLDDALRRFHEADRRPGRDEGERRLELRQLLGRFVAVCNTIAYAHSRGILHRDLKPGNIMLGKYGETLVVDWGLAKTLPRAAAARAGGEETPLPISGAEATGTQMGRALGTPVYMSPEQAAGRWDVVRETSDIYSLGATLYALLTGQPPVQGGDAKEVMDKVRRGVVAAPRQVNPRVSAALDAVCRKAMAREPERRYATALELAQEVERWLADEPVRAYREPRLARLARWGRRHRAITAGAAALLVTAVLALGFGLWAVRQEQARTAAAKEQAEERFGLAQDAVNHYLNQVTEDKQLKEKDFYALRKKLLAAAVPFYEQLARAKAGDPEQEVARARAYHRLGHLRRQIGEPEAAQADYEQTRAILTQLAADFPDVPQYRHELARNCNDLGVTLASQGNLAEAEAAYRQAIALQEKLVADSPTVMDYRHNLAKHCSALGNLLAAQGKRPEAEAAFRRALALEEQLAAAFTAVPEYRREVARTQLNLGVVLADLGKPAEAEAVFRRARDVQQQLADDFPGLPELRQELAGSHNNLGILLYGLGKRAEAEEAFRQSLSLLERLAAEFPSVPDYAVELGRGYANFGKVVGETGQVAASVDWFARACTTLRPVVAKEPRLVEARRDLRTAYWGRANALAQLNRHAEAAADWEQAVALNDEKPYASGLRLQWAFSLARAGRPTQATAAIEELLRSGNADAGTLYDAACVYAVAAAHAEKQSPPHTNSLRAEQYARRAVALLRQAVAKGYRDSAHLKKDPDLDPLQPRADFQQLLGELDARGKS